MYLAQNYVIFQQVLIFILTTGVTSCRLGKLSGGTSCFYGVDPKSSSLYIPFGSALSAAWIILGGEG